MIALYRKELRALWPLGLLTFAMLSGDLFSRPFTERLDEQAWEDVATYVQPGDPGALGWVLIVLAVAAAYSAFPREHDERTIRFLRSLPIRPAAIFGAKVAAGLTVLFAGLVGLAITDGLQGSLSPESLGGGHWRASLALGHLFVQSGFVFVAYAHGLLASVLRRFGLIPYALVLVVAHVLEDVFPPAAWIDPNALLSARYVGEALSIPWVPLAVHAAVALLALAAAYAAWMGPAERIGASLERARASIAGKLAVGCGTLVAVLFVLVLAVVVSDGADDEGAPLEEDPIATPSFETAAESTARYELTFPVSHERRARALIDAADGLHEEVRRRLDAEPGPVLVADLTEVSGEHLGIAAWTHIRVGIVTEPDPVRLRRTFTHETVHAFQHRLSDRRQGDNARATRFFAEGSAEHLAFAIVPDEAARSHARRIAAASWERLGVRFDALSDDARLRERFDTTLAYSLSELWVAALVEAHGEAAIGAVLRAMGRPDAPRGLAPRPFWEDTLRAAGFDLEAVDAAFAAAVARELEAQRAAIDALPRIGGGVTGADARGVRVVARLDRDPEPGWRYLVRVRRGPEASDPETFGVEGRADPEDPRRVVFHLPRALVPARRFQLLFSVETEPHGWPWSETWQWASLPP